MTVQPTRDQLRANAPEGGPWGAVVLALLDQLDQAEARIKAVEELCDARENPDQWPPRPRLHGGELLPASLMVRDIRRALEG